jgi:Domain of unknown function (DUF4965)/Domain of unknown function (DUF5127)/Domain of unknown function (DUF1793)/Domain of unknown function (DUF4964)
MIITTHLCRRAVALCAAVLFSAVLTSLHAETFRPPSVPLVACDPYFSIWSPADKLTDADTTHWTGKARRMTGLVRIDGKNFCFMGTEPAGVPELPQTGLEVLPTRTIYNFEGQGVHLTVTFLTAALPDDLDLLSRPVTYLTWESRSTDKQKHKVAVYFDARGAMACETPDQPVSFEKAFSGKVKAWRVGTVEQPVLQKRGDDLRIDWGYFYVAMANNVKGSLTANEAEATRTGFMTDGKLPAPAAKASLENNDRNNIVLAFASNLDCVPDKTASTWLMLAYDDVYSIQYMRKNLRPYWRRNGWEAADLLKAAARDYATLQKRCAAFDDELMNDLRNVGGENYAKLAALAYRQCFAAGKFVADENGQPLQFCKENHSNGCISTSDVFYPMAPQFLLFGPTLAKSFMVPFMNYATSERWKFPFAPHDLGTYPKANGQVYGDGEHGVNNQMPVEETGNLLCLFAAVAEMEGNANFAGLYWTQLERWADYLKEKGFDPEKQLCTDDFAGHLAHNVNLSVKAICGLGSFAKLCEMRGDKAKADEYYKIAREFAQRWMKEADDGDHFRLAFDKPGSWSQKYNLVWDRVLGLNLFPAEVARKEMAFYKKMQNEFGLPLDNRRTYTKLDWITWTATLTENREDFDALVAPIVHFLNHTPDRSPMTDWYETKSAKKVGFTARPVVGGVFMRMLYEKPIWQKYAKRDKTKATNWAVMPKLPGFEAVMPAADTKPGMWRYTTSQPAENWFAPEFNASSWSEGKGGFGKTRNSAAVIGTEWTSNDIWLRREVEFNGTKWDELLGWLHHDDDAEVYINGVLALKTTGATGSYEDFYFNRRGRSAIKHGKNVIAVHCRNTGGEQYIDFGLVRAKTTK